MCQDVNASLPERGEQCFVGDRRSVHTSIALVIVEQERSKKKEASRGKKEERRINKKKEERGQGSPIFDAGGPYAGTMIHAPPTSRVGARSAFT